MNEVLVSATERRQGSREARTTPSHDSALAHGMALTISQLTTENDRLRDIVLRVAGGGVEKLLALGEFFNYPPCCVTEFVVDMIHGRYPAELRPSAAAPSGDGTYVLCSACAAEREQAA